MLIPHTSITPRISDLFGRIEYSRDIKYLKKYIPHKHIEWTGSGREALRQILMQSNAKNVGVQAFTCHVVLDAIKAAGCKPIFYESGAVAEVDEIKEIIGKIDTLVVPYNFGFLPEIDKIASLCKKNKVTFIEDCAAALGARYKNRLAGTFGDYAFYSFGISKCIGFVGGLAASDKPLKRFRVKKFSRLELAKTIIEVTIAPLFFNPYLYPITKHLLSIELDKKDGKSKFQSYNMPMLGINVILNQFKRYEKIMQKRRENAKILFARYNKYNPIIPLKNTEPAWLYFLIHSNNRQQLIDKLDREEIEFSFMRTYHDLSRKSKKALKEEKTHVIFSLYTSFLPKKE